MREIKFRGYTGKRWVYGHFIHNGIDAPAIVWGDGEQEEVFLASVGQLTGMKDKNGIDIYEKDIVKGRNGFGEIEIAEVVYSDCSFYPLQSDEFFWKDIEVIGNVTDNPKLLEGKE